MAFFARDLMEACLVHQRALKRLVEQYPWAESLVPDLMEGIWAGSGSRTPHTPYQERSRLSSYDPPQGLKSLGNNAKASVFSDGSNDSGVAVFETLPMEEEQKEIPVTMLDVGEVVKVNETFQSSEEAASLTVPKRKSMNVKSWKSQARQTTEFESALEETPVLDAFAGAGVILNALLIAFELECEGARASISIGLVDGMQCEDARPLFLVTEHFFTAFFALELCWRISRARLAYFMDWFNVFDAFLVLAGCLDLYVLQAVMESQSYLRMLRLFKLARVVRLVRVTQMFRGLRLLVSACGSFLPALGWAMALLSLCMIMGGVTIGFLLQGYIEDENHPFESRKWIWLHYGTAYRATYTMYEITMAGNWPTNVRPVLENVNHAYVFFFVGYITVVVFAIIRVITAIFLSQTLEAANNDVEVMIQERMRKKSMFVEQLEGIFEAIDESGDGLLSEEEMKELLADSKVQAYMESLEVALPESEALFRLLQNSDGQITYEDFIEGILRCKGPARAVDQIVLHSEVKSLNTLIQKLQDKMEEAHLIQTCKRRRNKKHHTGLASHRALLSSPTRSRASLYVK